MKLLSRNYRKLMADFRAKCELIGGRGHRAFDRGECVGRSIASDVAITFRMPTGWPGDVNRTHPATIEGCLIDPSHPPTFYGQAVIADASSVNGVRVPATGDSGVTQVWGVTVRPYPLQQSSATNYGQIALGAATPPVTGPIDVLRRGYIMVTLQGAAAATKGGTVYVCVVAGTGYVVGGFSADTVSGTFATLDASYSFNGPAGADGVVELIRA